MTAGVAPAAAAAALDSILATATYVAIHVGDPGAAGTANAAATATRQSLTWGAASGGSKAITNQPAWASYPSAQTIRYVSLWTASTSGTFKGSAALATPTDVAAAGTFTLTALSATLGPVAA